MGLKFHRLVTTSTPRSVMTTALHTLCGSAEYSSSLASCKLLLAASLYSGLQQNGPGNYGGSPGVSALRIVVELVYRDENGGSIDFRPHLQR